MTVLIVQWTIYTIITSGLDECILVTYERSSATPRDDRRIQKSIFFFPDSSVSHPYGVTEVGHTWLKGMVSSFSPWDVFGCKWKTCSDFELAEV